MKKKVLIAFNEAREFALATNELSVDGEWLKISPYGDFPNKVGLQRIQRSDAEAMVTAFNSLRGRVARAFMGLPVFAGHPDMEPAQYLDKRRYGKITALEARDDGFYGQVSFNDLGKSAMDQGHFQFNSPAWYLRREGKFVRPVELISIGLTNTPQIPGEPWAKNDNESNTMPKWLTDLLVAKGLMKADGDETAAQAAVNSLAASAARVPELETKLTTATNEQTRLTTELATANGKVTTLAGTNATLTTERDNLVSARNKLVLDVAVNAGRIKEADRAGWNTKLTTSFEDNLKALNELKPDVNTQSQVGGLGQRKSEVNAGNEKITAINAAVRKYATEQGLDVTTNAGYNAAFAGARQTQPALFN